MTDKIYEKQLEQFGTNATVIERQRTPMQARSTEYVEAVTQVVKDLMNTVQGRHWMWEKLMFCGTLGFTCDPERAHTASYFRGMQDVGLALYHEINAIAPDMILTMNQEAAQRNMAVAKRLQPDE